MTNILKSFLLLASFTLIVSSCDSDNSCDNVCPASSIQLLDCSCALDANDIVPHPCPTMTCSDGQALAVMGGSCACVQIAMDVCGGKSCADDEVLDATSCECVKTASVTETINAGIYTEDITMTTGNTYILNGRVIIGAGVTLTIQSGVVIKGSEGQEANASALLIARGATIMAMGTSDEPIIMTSIADNIQPGDINSPNLTIDDNGLWGGLIILGNAPVSTKAGAEGRIEGVPADIAEGLYGGSDEMDNSGVIRYVSVRHGGTLIGEGNEINGITLGGVGAGTIIENVEVIANVDDGIEFFGGTVNVKNAIVWAQGDDAFDIDQSFSGTVDNYVTVAGAGSDHSFEIDGPESDANPDGRFTMINGTAIGSLDAAKGEMQDWRSNAQGTIMNTYFFNYNSSADIELDNDEVSTNFGDGKIVISGCEFTLTSGTTLADVAADKATTPQGDFDSYLTDNNTTVAAGAATVGADLSIFDWTYTKANNGI